MRSTAAARRYARALFSIARDDDAIGTIRAELAGLASLLDSTPDLARRLFRPLHPVAERRSVLAAVCRAAGNSQTISNFLSYLIDQRRLIDFAAIREEYERLADEAAGRVRAEVRSASPLRDDQQERLKQALARRTGKEIDLSVQVDPSLLGGAIATLGGLVIDGSLRTQLEQLQVTLTQGRGSRSG